MTDPHTPTRPARARRVAASALFYTGVWAIAVFVELPIIMVFTGGRLGWINSIALATIIGLGVVVAGVVTADRSTNNPQQ